MKKNTKSIKHVRKNENNNIHKKISNNILTQNKGILKEVEKSKKEALRTSVPIHYVKVDEKITTTVYEIPINKNVLKENNVIFRKNYVLNTINNDKLQHLKKNKNNYFPFKPFSSKEMGYKYYNQKLNTFYPHDNSKNFLYLRKSKSPDLQSSFMSTRMNSLDNKDFINNRNIFRYRSPQNNLRNKNLNSPFYQRFLNKTNICINNRNRIRHRIINLSRSNDFIENIIQRRNDNNLYNGYEFNNSNRTINYNNKYNLLNNTRRVQIDLDSNNSNNNLYNNKNNMYSIDNTYIFGSPQNRQLKKMFFINDRNIDSPHKSINYESINGGRIMRTLEKNKSKDGKYEIGTTLSKKIYDKLGNNDSNGEIEEIQVIENNAWKHSRRLSEKKDLGDNYKYYERAEIKSPLRNRKNNDTNHINHINHIRRSPVHVYQYENYIIKDNKKIYVQTPIKGKLIRVYRNNVNKSKNCKMCLMKDKNRVGHLTNIKGNTILLPSKFKKREFNSFIK